MSPIDAPVWQALRGTRCGPPGQMMEGARNAATSRRRPVGQGIPSRVQQQRQRARRDKRRCKSLHRPRFLCLDALSAKHPASASSASVDHRLSGRHPAACVRIGIAGAIRSHIGGFRITMESAMNPHRLAVQLGLRPNPFEGSDSCFAREASEKFFRGSSQLALPKHHNGPICNHDIAWLSKEQHQEPSAEADHPGISSLSGKHLFDLLSRLQERLGPAT
jgi:hypothetical protein